MFNKFLSFFSFLWIQNVKILPLIGVRAITKYPFSFVLSVLPIKQNKNENLQNKILLR